MPTPYRVAITADIKIGIPGRLEPVLAEVFDPLPYLEYEYVPVNGQDELGKYMLAGDVAGFDAILGFGARFPAASFQQAERLAVISRWGVGYDMIDVPACTAANVLLAITTDAVRRPVAEAIVTLIHALATRMIEKDRLVRTGRWAERAAVSSVGLRGKVVGSVGVGNIASEMFRLLEPWGLQRKLAADPYARPEQVAQLGVEMVDLPTLFRESDFVTINCPLTDETHGLINADLIGLMKPSAYLVNTARGPIVKQDDLVAALQAGRIAGAGLDVFEVEPLPAEHQLTRLENVILAPHALAWTDELYYDNSVAACQQILSVLRGDLPQYIVNKQVTTQLGLQSKLAALRARWQAGWSTND